MGRATRTHGRHTVSIDTTSHPRPEYQLDLVPLNRKKDRMQEEPARSARVPVRLCYNTNVQL